MSVWSRQSQRAVVREISLQKELLRCEHSLGSAERRLAESQTGLDRNVQRQSQGDLGRGRAITDRAREISELERERAAFQDHAARLRAEIESLQPTPKGLLERAEAQARLARLATERLGKDRAIEAAIKKLRSLLEERARLSKSLAGIAPTIDLALDEDGFDEVRFAALAATLPTDLEQRSERWLRQFFGGSREETKSYTVLRGPFTLPETLGSAEVYPTGAKVELTKVESAKLLAELRPRIAEVSFLGRLVG